MTQVQLVRLSPSGRYHGNPAQRVGPGTVGLKWRAHGSGGAVAFGTSVVAIPGLESMPVDLRYGGSYGVRVYTEVQVVNGTVSPSGYNVYLQLRSKARQVWGTHTTYQGATPGDGTYALVNGLVHAFPFKNGASRDDCYQQYCDEAVGFDVTEDCDRLSFYVLGVAGAGANTSVIGQGCHVVVEEYLV